MSFPAMTIGERFCFSLKGGMGGGCAHPKGADSMAVSGLSVRNTLVDSGWSTAVLLCMNTLRKLPSHPTRRPFLGGGAFSQSIASLLMGGCGLSHEHVYTGWL